MHAKSEMQLCVRLAPAEPPWQSGASPVGPPRFASRTSKNGTSRPVRLRPTARRRDKPRRPRRLGPRTWSGGALPVPQYGAARARKEAQTELRARVNGRQRECDDPRPRIRRDSAGQPPPAGSASRRPTTSRSGTARHHRSDRQPSRGSPSTSRTSLRHRRAPQKKTRRRHRRSRAFPASISWPPIPDLMCRTGPSARRSPRRSPSRGTQDM